VQRYDPEVAPDPKLWLALDEQERIQLAEAHHRKTGTELPSLQAHAVFHAIVENQLAEGLEPVRRAIIRLMREGLTRHDAVHAIASVLAEYLFEVANAKVEHSASVSQARYNAALERLTASSWHRNYGAK